MNKNYVYILLRKDLPNAQRVVQCSHAVFEVSQAHKLAQHPSMVVLGLRDEKSLLREAKKLEAQGLKPFAFKEPLFNDETTAIAFLVENEIDRFHFKKYQLLNDESFLSPHDQKAIKIKNCTHNKLVLDYRETFAYEFTPVKVCKFCHKEVSRSLTDSEKSSLIKKWYLETLETTVSNEEIELKKNGFNL